MTLNHFLWPGGRRIALTSNWDDGTEHDRRLVDIFNREGLKASFHLCSGKLGLTAAQSGWRAFVGPKELRDLYAGHEVCSHTVDHPRLWSLSEDQARWQLCEDRRRLEDLAGYPVRGFAVPYGWPAGQALCRDLAKSCGFRYLRNSVTIPQFDHPSDFLDWHPNATCSDDLGRLWDSAFARSQDQPGQLFAFYGHSYEFEDDLGWESIESFARRAGGQAPVYHATNGEIYEYVMAWRSLDWSLDGSLVRNPSATRVWFLRDGEPTSVAGGESMRLKPRRSPS